MNASDADRVRPASPAGRTDARSDVARRFDDALRRAPQDYGGDGGEGTSDEGGSSRRVSYQAELQGRALPSDMSRLFSAALDHSLPRHETGDDRLDALLHDIADGVRAGRNLPGARWRLLVRLRSELLPSTEVDISCAGGPLAVVLRTANEDAYRTIVEALPRLNKALNERRGGGTEAVVFLVAPKDLH